MTNFLIITVCVISVLICIVVVLICATSHVKAVNKKKKGNRGSAKYTVTFSLNITKD